MVVPPTVWGKVTDPPPAAHVQTAGLAAVHDKKVLLPEGCATGSCRV